jgi:putative aminopeptidase FrvX
MAPIKLLTDLCSTPTAPFAEDAVVRFVERFAAKRRRLKLSRDPAGNLLLELPPRSRAHQRRPRWVFGAHMDHPGFVADRMIDARTLEARFHGWVAIEYVRGTKVRFFDGDREITGKVIEATPGEHDRLAVPSRVKVRVRESVPAAAVGMFDVGGGRVRGKRFHSRVCDNLAGASAALAMLDQLLLRPPRAPVAVLLTRAEEEGFIGAIAAVRKPRLLRKTDRMVIIECSAMQPYAPQGKGTIIRVGDRTSIFNSALTYFLTRQAEELGKRDKTFKHQRALMPGGTCEATVYDAFGYLASSICVPLGNYHNMDRDRGRIAAEYIDLGDWMSMVKLFVQVAQRGHEFDPSNSALRQRVEQRFKKFERFIRPIPPGRK